MKKSIIFVLLFCVFCAYAQGENPHDSYFEGRESVPDDKRGEGVGKKGKAEPVICNYPIGSDDFVKCLNGEFDGCTERCKLEQNKRCAWYAKKNDGFLDEESMFNICLLKCPSFSVLCGQRDTWGKKETKIGVNVDEYVTKLREKLTVILEEQLEDDFDPSEILMTDKTYEKFYETLVMVWPILLSLVPIVLNQYEYFSFWNFIGSMLLLFAAYIYFDFTTIQFIFNSMIWVLCLAADAGRSPVRDVTISYALVVVCMFAMFLIGPALQFIVGGLVFIGFVLYLKWIFIEKRNYRGQNVVMLIGLTLVMGEQVALARVNMMMQSFGSAALVMVSNCVLPFGDTRYFWANSVKYARIGVIYVESDYKVTLFALFWLLQIIGFVVFRCLFGMYVVNSLRFKFTFGNFVLGGMMYTADVFGGVVYVLQCALNMDNWNSKRLSYAIVNIILVYYEWRASFGFLNIRLFCYIFDALFYGGYLTRLPRFLNIEIDMRGQAFPQPGEAVWLAMDQLNQLGKHVVRIRSEIDGKMYSGLGFIIEGSNKLCKLLTIDHVGKSSRIEIDTRLSMSKPDIFNLTKSRDPIVSIPLKDWDHGGSEIYLLGEHELKDVVQYYVYSLSDGKDAVPMIYGTNNFEVDKNGDLRVYCSLKQGDSGGPVFAALNNGVLRYAGAVSRASDERGRGHIFSFVIAKGSPMHDSDDDSAPGVTDKHVIKFNKDRGNLSMVLAAQERLKGMCDEFGQWVVDQSTEKGVRWVNDDVVIVPRGDEEKVNYERRKKKYRKERERRLAEIDALAALIFDEDEMKGFKIALLRGTKLPFNGIGRVTFTPYGEAIVDDNPNS